MRYLLPALVMLVIADGVITQFLVGKGLAREGNPLLKPLVGEYTFIVLKVVGALVCSFILRDMYQRWAKLALIATWCLTATYGAIVAWNMTAYVIAV